jgi:hypothetical protein
VAAKRARRATGEAPGMADDGLVVVDDDRARVRQALAGGRRRMSRGGPPGHPASAPGVIWRE